MHKVIKIGFSMNGPIYGDYDKYKSCNFCKSFCGYGLHWFAGKCKLKNIELGLFDYLKTAKECDNFDCEEELISYKD